MIGGSNPGREGLLGADSCAASASSSGDRGLAQLQETNRIAAETTALGANIMETLGHQRGQLEGAIETRREAHEGLSVSNRLIRRMHIRATWIKCALIGMVLMLLGGVILIVYLHWFSGKKHHSPPSLLSLASPPAPPPPEGRLLQSDDNDVRLHEPQDGIGEGLIILIVVGALSLIACATTIPKGLVARCSVCFLMSTLFGATALLLLLLPMEDVPTVRAFFCARRRTRLFFVRSARALFRVAGGRRALLPACSQGEDTGPSPIKDASTIQRLFMISGIGLVTLLGLGCVLVFHVMAVQKAPVVVEAEPVPVYRVAKAHPPPSP